MNRSELGVVDIVGLLVYIKKETKTVAKEKG